MRAVATNVTLTRGATIETEAPVRLEGPLTIRSAMRIGAYSYIRGPATISRLPSVGRYCSIAPGLTAGESSHPIDWLSTSPFQFSTVKFEFADWHNDFSFIPRNRKSDAQKRKTAPLIGNDVWIGSNVTLLNGITVGDGAIIAAGSIVTKSVPPYAIVAGVPARIIRMRFTESLIARLLEIRWWRFDARSLSGLPFNDPNAACIDLQKRIEAGEITELPPRFEELAISGGKRRIQSSQQTDTDIRQLVDIDAKGALKLGTEMSDVSAHTILSGATTPVALQKRAPIDREKVRATLAQERPTEVSLAAYKRDLERVYADLLKAIGDEPNDQELIVLTARTELKLERWHSSAIRWEEISRHVGPYRAEAYLALAVIHRNLGAYTRSFSFIKTAEARGASPDDVRRELRRVRRKIRSSAAGTLASNASAAITEGNNSEARSLLLPALRLEGVSEVIRNAVDAVLGGSPAPAAPQASHTPRVIFIGGFGWSGSGALADYLAQHPATELPFGQTEALLFSESEGTAAIANDLAGAENASSMLLHHFLRAVYGVMPAETSDLTSARARSVFWQDEPDHERVSKITTAVLNMLKIDWKRLGPKKASECVGKFYGNVLSALVSPGRIGLASNCITAGNFNLLQLIPGGFGVAMLRDPRDQYVAQRYEHRSGNLAAVDRFIAKLRRRLRAFEKAEVSLGSSKIMKCQFEDFILSSDYRRSVLDRLGLPENLIVTTDRMYRPQDSVNNIGMHKAYGEKHELRQIEEAFPSLLRD